MCIDLYFDAHGGESYRASGEFMNASRIDKNVIVILQFLDCRATALRVSSIEDLQQVPFNDLLDRLFHLVLL
jgi:hypothetical protein